MKKVSEYIVEKLKINSKKAQSETSWRFGAEGSAITDHVDCMSLSIEDADKKKYGFITYEETAGDLAVMTFDSIDDLADAYSCDADTFEFLNNIEVGEIDYSKGGTMYFRMW